jgi:PAS domain S-box-containing protein
VRSPAKTGSGITRLSATMNRSSARLRRAFALVVAIGVVALVGVAWATHEQSVRLDETAGWADRTRASVAAVQADDAVALTAEHPDQALALLRDGKGVQMQRDIEGFANAMVANEGRRFDERIVIGRNARHAAETYAGVALMPLVTVMSAAAIFILRELKLRAAVTAALTESRGRLELGERRLRAITDNMPAYIAYVDKTETYRFTNAAFSTLFGVPYEAFIGRTMTGMMGRRTRDELAAYVEGALACREMHFERQGMALQADSTSMVSYIPDFDKCGGVDGYYVMSLDITARKKAELELANSERRLRTITDNLPATSLPKACPSGWWARSRTLAMRERQFEMQWVTRIESAIDDDGFVLYAQRLTPLKHRPDASHGVHAAVLLRMGQDGGPLVAPGAFLPAAERFHLASRNDRWVLRKVVDWMAALREPARIALLSVNLSGQSVGDRSFHRWALDVLAKAGPTLCGALCLEIAETAAVTNIADAAVFIDQVRAFGVKVTLDDFGAGAASFGYLKTLRVDTLKIDGQFVRDVVDDPLDEVAVRCFADMAKVMGLTTVAEFVDKPAVLARLHEMDVDFAQGYLLHEPAPIAELGEPATMPT